MNKKIMILGASILQLPAIKCAKEMGLEVIAVDMNPNAIGFEEDVTKEIISTIDIPAVVEAAKKHRVDGVMTLASDMPMRTVAAVSKELGLVGIADDTALKATNKACMREALHEYGVPIPKFFKVSNKKEYDEAVKQFSCTFIVKPADNSGSRGIFLVDDLSDKKGISEAYEYSHKYSRNGDVVVEEYMRGPEVSVETLTVDGECHVIQITDKLTTGAPHFVEMGHSQPTHHPKQIADRIAEVAKMANKAVGITNGPSHTEIIVTEEGPKIVELGARLGGDCITTHLVPLSTGVDMVKSCILIALGEKPDIEKKFNKGSAIRYFAQKAGTICKIDGVEDAEAIDGVRQISFVEKVGAQITEIDSSAARLGFIIAQSDNAEAAVHVCEAAMKKITIEIE
ncbi:MAG: ATP-grasp domain-containing protein [Clostridia bacterium]|nr:ATP-grasp domain-containing protein [Clostridia bacterium]